MRTLLLSLLLLFAKPPATASEDFDSVARTINDAVGTCIGDQSTTAAMADCGYREFQAWDAELNRSYGSLMSRLPSHARSSLRNAQRAWLAYRDAEYENIDELMSMKIGTMYTLVRIAKRTAITEHRVSELSSHLHTLDN